jgi:2-methylcitrate dehydratase PrpD
VLHNPGVTEVLAKFVVDTRWDDLPPQVTHQAKRSLMNFFAVALTGCRDQTFETALQSLAAFSGGKQATLIGRRERIDALSAAFLNAAGANVLDFCDTHVPTAIHPTAPLAPALLALAELKPVSGRDLILAFVLGQEVECRVGLAISPSHYNKG